MTYNFKKVINKQKKINNKDRKNNNWVILNKKEKVCYSGKTKKKLMKMMFSNKMKNRIPQITPQRQKK
jgi:hypothetical protein